LSKEDIPVTESGLDTNYKMSPPLRGTDDTKAMREGLAVGTVDCIATDHAPHSASDKSGGWESAANGVVGLETAFSVCYTNLVKNGTLTISGLIEKMSVNPSKILGIDKGKLSAGSAADIAIIDLNEKFVINKDNFKSLGRNTPWHGMEVYGKVCMTILKGEIICWQ
jgi:dihydroorotase